MSIGGYKWVKCRTDESMPIRDMVDGGIDKDGSLIYVGRAEHANDMIPAKVVPDRHMAYISYEGVEHEKNSIEVLCRSNVRWILCKEGEVPPHAVEAGRTSYGETLYVGRVWYEGSQTIGKVHPSEGYLYVAFDGKEKLFKDYEVLVIN